MKGKIVLSVGDTRSWEMSTRSSSCTKINKTQRANFIALVYYHIQQPMLLYIILDTALSLENLKRSSEPRT